MRRSRCSLRSRLAGVVTALVGLVFGISGGAAEGASTSSSRTPRPLQYILLDFFLPRGMVPPAGSVAGQRRTVFSIFGHALRGRTGKYFLRSLLAYVIASYVLVNQI